MDKRRLKINQGRLLPLWLRLLITALLFSAVIYANLYLNEELAVLALIIFSSPVLPLWYSYQLLEIDPDARAYQRGYWIAGYKAGKWIGFNTINEIRIVEPKNKGLVSFFDQRKSYEAYLVFDDSRRLYLIGSNSVEQLKERLEDIYEKLNLKK